MHGGQVSDGLFLVDYFAHLGHTFAVRRVAHAERCCVPGGQSSPTLETVGHDVGLYNVPPTARQRGQTTGIDTGDCRLQFAVWRAGKLSTGQNTSCGGLFGQHACVAFTELDVSGFPTNRTLNDWVLEPPPGADFYCPAVDVNSSGNKTMVFSGSGENDFASADFVGIPPSDLSTNCINTGGQPF